MMSTLSVTIYSSLNYQTDVPSGRILAVGCMPTLTVHSEALGLHQLEFACVSHRRESLSGGDGAREEPFTLQDSLCGYFSKNYF